MNRLPPLPLTPPLIALLRDPDPDLRWYHELGRQTRRLKGTREYGARIMERIAAATHPKNQSVTLDVLYRCVKFVNRYPERSEVTQWQKRGLSWNHMKQLVVIQDERLRRRLLQHTLQHNWSCRELTKEIIRESGVRSRRGRRRIETPESLNDQADLERLVRQNEDWLLLWQNVWQSKNEQLSSIQRWEQPERGQEDVDRALLQLRQMRTAIRQLENALKSVK